MPKTIILNCHLVKGKKLEIKHILIDQNRYKDF